ncbi:uncharacterized protein LOC115754749 [Rhodamnia argentea]|uniref:Uncharacterized protein LOC115754749 n=1 Tax=Rhodamnia argentea TaxID=178133 RepID=A0ABM3H2Z5_9MYRT|nr:uncharacterized protein LOC115754749 [Rhodamnia argentea]
MDGEASSPEGGCLVDGEAVDLLEEYWFFGNLLQRKNGNAIMSRCFSDPCPSVNDEARKALAGNRQSNGSSPPSPRKTDSEGIGHFRADAFRTPPVLHGEARDEAEQVQVDDGTPEEVPVSAELPTLSKEGVRERKCDSKEGSLVKHKHKQPPRPVLLRAPSLPPCIGRDQAFEGRENFPRMIKPSRQASLNLSEFLPPRHTPKGMTQSAQESAIAFNKEMRRRYLTKSNSRKSLTDLEDEEVQGFKELGFSFDRKHLNPNLVNLLPGLQVKTQENEDAERNEGPYLSEEWLVQSYAPTVPKWNAKGGSPEDVKAQIKSWARVVASNVRQEC